MLLRGAERIWPPSVARWSVAVPNGDGVASGSAIFKKNLKKRLQLIIYKKLPTHEFYKNNRFVINTDDDTLLSLSL